MKKLISALLIAGLTVSLFAGCSQAKKTGSTNQNSNSPTGAGSQDAVIDAAPAAVDFSKTDEDMFTERDKDAGFEADRAVQIQLSGTSAVASSNSVQISGSTIVLKEEATYLISGVLDNGMIIVDAPEKAKLQLVLSGAQITNETSAALYILEADKVFLTLAEGTDNALANGGSFVAIDENNIDSALFSKQDLTMNGRGTLTVSSPAGHGIVSKDDLVITGGTYVVNSASHGLDANDSVRITDAALTIDAGKDAIHCENDEETEKGFVYISGGSIKAEAEGDGITASAYMQIEDGTIDLLVGGGNENGTKSHSDYFGGYMGGRPGQMPPGSYPGSTQNITDETSTSMKGLKATSGMLISGGSFTIDSADDAIHSNLSLTLNGGTFTIASGDDAFHAEDTLTVTAGTMEISTCYEGLEALHIDVQGGNIKLVASDDGLNAAGGTDQSGSTGGRDGMYGAPRGGMGGRPGGNGGGMGGYPGGGFGGNSNGSIQISGGILYINSSGDGIDANGTLEISGGHITVVGPIQGDTATLDYDKTGVITGGTFIGTGSTMMAQSFSDSTQGVVALKVGSRAAGTEIQLADASGKVLITRTPELDFAVVILSSPEIVKGETYTITIGGVSEIFKAS